MRSSLTISATRANAAMPFTVTAAVSVIAGGLLAAAFASDPGRYAVWASAYLVLVVGVIQFALGLGQALLAAEVPAAGLVASEWIVMNLGNAAVIVGTLITFPSLVAVGGALLVIALALFLYGTRTARPHWSTYTYRILLILVLLSIAIGVGLSASRG